MPNGVKNWTFRDVVDFLTRHDFTLDSMTGGSHRYFSGYVDGEDRLVEVQYHASKVIKPKTLKLSIIRKSGIPDEVWLEWAKAGNKRNRKKIKYPGAKKREKQD